MRHDQGFRGRAFHCFYLVEKRSDGGAQFTGIAGVELPGDGWLADHGHGEYPRL
jgi:hypothetical protein